MFSTPSHDSQLVTAPVELLDWEGPLPDESNEEYHLRQGYHSSSEVKQMLRSPWHFKRLVLEKKSLPPRDPKEAFDLGSSCHECFLQKDTSQFVVYPAATIDKRTKLWTEFSSRPEVQGKRIITGDQSVRMLAMLERLKQNKKAQSFVNDPNSMMEKGFLYMDPETGLPCRFKPDILNLHEGYIVDYKTAAGASPYEFRKAVARYQYHLSAVHYLEGVYRLFKQRIRNYYFLVQESSEPYAVAIYRMNLGDLERSYELRSYLMQKIKYHSDKNYWPDWSEDTIELDLPAYAFDKETIE